MTWERGRLPGRKAQSRVWKGGCESDGLLQREEGRASLRVTVLLGLDINDSGMIQGFLELLKFS